MYPIERNFAEYSCISSLPERPEISLTNAVEEVVLPRAIDFALVVERIIRKT